LVVRNRVARKRDRLPARLDIELEGVGVLLFDLETARTFSRPGTNNKHVVLPDD
jgi:hypothetical protein